MKKLKPPTKIAGWSNLNGFDSWMAKDTQFFNLMVKTKPRPELDNQKWIFLKKIKGSTGGQVSRWTRFQFQDSERASRKKIWARTAFFFFLKMCCHRKQNGSTV